MPEHAATSSPTVSELVFSQAEERDWQGGIEGSLPGWARGSLFLNGPAGFIRGGLQRRHWLDGDGLVRRLRFGDGRAAYRSRYVRTQRLVEEQAAGRALFRSFGTALDGDRLRDGLALYSPANVSAHPYGGRLLAFGEQSLPWTLDPDTLETLGECSFGGTLSGIAPLSAHPKVDGYRGHLCNFGSVFQLSGSRFRYYEWDRDLKQAVYGETALPDRPLVHDCLVSEHYAVFHLSHYQLDILGFARGGRSLLGAMRWEPGHESRLLVVSRASGEKVALCPAGSTGFCLHTINAYEHGHRLIVDLLEAEAPYYDRYFSEPGLFAGIGPSVLRRVVLDTRDWRPESTDRIAPGLHLDFPCIDPRLTGRDYRHAWLQGMPTETADGTGFYDRLLRFDWRQRGITDRYQSPAGQFLGAEPQLLAHPEETDKGMLVCQAFDLAQRRSAYLFFDAWDLGRGPVARIGLPFFDPPALHSVVQP